MTERILSKLVVSIKTQVKKHSSRKYSHSCIIFRSLLFLLFLFFLSFNSSLFFIQFFS